MMKIKLISIVWLLLTAPLLLAQAMESPQQTRTLSDRIISHFIKKQFDEGLTLAKPHWPIPEAEIDVLGSKIKTQWPIVDQRFGQAIGSEFIKSIEIGDSLLRYYYLHKFKNHAIYWQITFYKPESQWVMNSIVFKDDLDILFKLSR